MYNAINSGKAFMKGYTRSGNAINLELELFLIHFLFFLWMHGRKIRGKKAGI